MGLQREARAWQADILDAGGDMPDRSAFEHWRNHAGPHNPHA